jgi:hypothetical protein
MKNFTQHRIFGIQWPAIVLGIVFLLLKQEMQAQYISNNGASVSISSGTVVSVDTINNDNATTLANEGIVTMNTFNNAGTTQGDGTYNIAGDFTNIGTFFSSGGTVNMNGTLAQNMTLAVSIFNNLIIDNPVGVSLYSTQTITKNLTINSGKIFKIEADKTLTVNGLIANSGGNAGLVLKSTAAGTASLIHNTDGVPATVQRYISGAAEDWHFLSAPVSDQVIAGSSWVPKGSYGTGNVLTGTGYDMYIWNEPTPCWTYQLNATVVPTWPFIHSSPNFMQGRGYLYSTQALNPTKEFRGLLNNGLVSIPVTRIGPYQGPEINDVRGFNLIGNPYPSSIDWKAGTGWARTNLVSNVGGGYDMWIWNPASNNYGVYNSTGTIGTNGVTQYIAPTQGYFVRAASSGTVSLTNASRVNDGASNWLKITSGKGTINNLKIRIASNEGHGYDEVLLQFGYPTNEAGALKLFSRSESAPSAYLNDLKKDLSVRYLTDTNENSQVPLQFKAGKDGNYAISIGNESTSFDVLLLEDKKTKTVSDLNVNPIYQFKGAIKDATDRFVLHFAPITAELVNLPAVIYYDGNEINVDLTLIEEQTDIKIYDMLGKLLVDKKGEGKMIHRFTISPKNEVYIVLASSKGKYISRKVLVY